MADSLQPASAQRVAPETSAWIWLSFFFALFCALLLALSIVLWNFYTGATVAREALVRVHVQAGIAYQPTGSPNLVLPSSRCLDSNTFCINSLRENEPIVVRPEAGFGPVASLVLPDSPTLPSQIDLWAHPYGARVTITEHWISRWTQREMIVRVRHEAGYARYDLRRGQEYDQVVFQVDVGNNVLITLQPGGSYSIYVPRDPNGQLVRSRVAVRDTPMLVEVATREGEALIVGPGGQKVVRPNERLAVGMGGAFEPILPTSWQLIADGDFTRYTSAEYNSRNGTDTWSINSSIGDANMPVSEQNGLFATSLRCPPTKVDFCDPNEYVSIAQFRRDGGQTRSFITAITQTLNIDVSEYRELNLSVWVRVLNQSVPLAGVRGSECPLMIYLLYKETNPSDQEQRYIRCIYSLNAPGDDAAMVRAPEIVYTPMAPFSWTRLEIKLRDEPQLRKARYIQMIRIEARGHDYLTEFTDVSLVGQQ